MEHAIEIKTDIFKCSYGALIIFQAEGCSKQLEKWCNMLHNYADKEPHKVFNMPNSKFWYINKEKLINALKLDYFCSKWSKDCCEKTLEENALAWANNFFENIPTRIINYQFNCDNKEKGNEHDAARA